jgi:MSHA biogenesis protein MshI
MQGAEGIRMKLQLPFFGLGAQGWTAFDATDDGYCAVSVSTSAGKPQVVRCAHSADTPNGADALRQLAGSANAPGYPCTLVLARGEYQMLVVAEPPVLESELLASLRWSLAPMIEFPVDDAAIAWMRIPTAEFQPTREKQLYAVVSRHSLVEQHAAMFEKAKVPLTTVDVRETALRNIAVLLEKKAEGLALLTVGSTGVTTTFTFRGELYLDRFIAQPMVEIMEGDAQRRQKFFDRVAQQVYQSMELITRSHPFISIDRVVLGPLPGLQDLGSHLAGKLPVPVQALDLASIFDLSAVPALLKPENQARYLVALGGALRGRRTTT